MIDETRIQLALRQGPPFRTPYVPRPLPVSLEVVQSPFPTRAVTVQVERVRVGMPSWASISVTLTLAVIIGGASLIGSGAIKMPVRPDQNATAAWITTDDMVTPRSGFHTVTLLANGSVLVAGGAVDAEETLRPSRPWREPCRAVAYRAVGEPSPEP